MDRSSYDCWISVFTGGTAKKLFSIGNNSRGTIIMLGANGQYVYYCSTKVGSDEENYLYCYDIETQQKSLLYSGSFMSKYSCYFTDEGDMFLKLYAYHAAEPQYLHIRDDRLIGIVPSPETYRIGNEIYWMGNKDEHLYRRDQNNETVELTDITRYADKYTMIPCEQGLLIHCYDSGPAFLLLIDTAGDIHEIFQAECMRAYSAATVCGNYAYLSFMRFKDYGEIGMRRFENDTMEGLYRISLIDYHSEKLSDKIFDGLYNFDDTCLWACDMDCNIYQLDLDGNILCEAFHVYTYGSYLSKTF